MHTKKTKSIRSRLLILCSILLLNVAILGVVGFVSSKSLGNDINELANVQLPAVRDMSLLDMMHDGIRAVAFRALLVTDSDTKEKEEVEAEIAEMSKNITEYLSQLSHLKLPTEVKEKIEAATPSVVTYAESANKLVKLAISGKKAEANAFKEDFQKAFENLETKLGEIGDFIEAKAQAEAKKSYTTAIKIQTFELWLAALGIFLGLVTAFYIARNLNRELKALTESLASEAHGIQLASEEMSITSRRLASAATEQASALQETASALNETSSMIQKSAESTENSNRVARESTKTALQGRQRVEAMVTAIGRISQSNAAIAKQVEDGNQRIGEIVEVIKEIGNRTKVINDIVFQTKLLSFNASVEAARAGEHGKGFAVVAEEVGNLAQMSGNAAQEIGNMLSSSTHKVESIVQDTRLQVDQIIGKSHQEVQEGIKVAKDCGTILDEIVRNEENMTQLMSEIAEAGREQAQGVSEINGAINQLDSVTHENSSIAEQTAKSSEQLRLQSQKLIESMKKLEQLADQTEMPTKPQATHSTVSVELKAFGSKAAPPKPNIQNVLTKKASK